MGKFGEITVGRIGCFKSDTIFLPSISYIALDRKREIDAGRRGGGHNATFRRVLHARVDQQRADGFSLYDDEVSFPRSFHTRLYVLLIVRCHHFCITSFSCTISIR